MAQESDIKTISTLANMIWNEYYVPIIGKEQVDYMLENFQSINAIKAQLKEGYLYFLCADSQGYAGYFSVKPQNDNGLFLSKIYLMKLSRGRGYSKLIIEFLKKFSQNKYTYINLTVNVNNVNSINIYKKLGFNIIDTQIADIGGGFVMDDYIMKMWL